MSKKILLILICATVLFSTACKKQAAEPSEQEVSAQRTRILEAAKARDEEMRNAPPITTASESDFAKKDTTALAISDGEIAKTDTQEETQVSRDIRTTRNLLAQLLYVNPVTLYELKPVNEAQLNKALDRISKLATVEKVERTNSVITVTYYLVGERDWDYILE